MPYTGEFEVFESIIQEIMMVYRHDSRPWLIGYSGGKDSTLLVSLVYEAVSRLMPGERKKKVYVITSDTQVENPIVKKYMHDSSNHINESSRRDGLNIEAQIIYPQPDQTFWSRVIGLGYPTPEPPGFRWCTERLKIQPMNTFVDERIKESGEIIILLGVRKAESLTRSRTITAREIEGRLTKDHPNNKYMERWYNNGGAVTHRAWKHCTKAYREEMMEAIKNLPLQCEVQVNGKTYLLVHGAPKGCFHKYNDEVMDSVWGRIEPYRAMPKGKTVIFGHTPTCKYQHVMPMSIWYGDDKIGIDCGCAYGLGGRLACLRLDDMKEFYSSAIGLKKK